MGQHFDDKDLLGAAGTVPVVPACGSGKPTIAFRKPQPMDVTEGREAEFPVECLGDNGAKAVRAMAALAQAPTALCAQCALSAMATSVSGFGRVKALHGQTMPMSLYFFSIARSGERKSFVDELAQKGICAFEQQMAVELQTISDAGSNQDVQDRISDVLVGEPTYEGLLRNLTKGPGIACLSNDDAAGFFGGYSMSKEQKQKMVAGLSRLWSGSTIKAPRANGGGFNVSGVPLSMSLMFQPYMIGQVYGDLEMVEQGILARVLTCYPRSTMGTRFFQEPDPIAEHVVDTFGRTVLANLHEMRARRDAFVRSDDVFADPCEVLVLSDGARRELISLHDSIEKELGAGGALSGIRGFAARATEQATRLAAVITLFDDRDAQAVHRDAAVAAKELMRFYMAEFSYVRRMAKTHSDQSEAIELGNWMAREYGAGGIGYDKNVSQFGPMAFRKKGARRQLMQSLIDHHWVAMLPAGTFVDGAKRDEAFMINPRITEVI